MRIAFLALGTAVVLPALSHARHYALYKVSMKYAVNDFGDRQAPLTDGERREWYSFIGFDSNSDEIPENKLLLNYIKGYEAKQEEQRR